jgi:hypothetical protein
LIGQEQQIFARRHIPKDARQHPNKRATIGYVPNAKYALKRRNAGGDSQQHHARPKPRGQPIPARGHDPRIGGNSLHAIAHRFA